MITNPLRRRGGTEFDADAGESDRYAIGPFPVPDSLVEGVVGGLLATIVMTAYRLPIARSLPPTAEFWATFVGSEGPEEYSLIALHLHLFYGAGGGAAFGAVYDRLPKPTNTSPEGAAALWGVVYGLALSIFGERVLLERLLGMRLSADERTVFHAGHAIYGLTLGTWVGSRGEGGE